MWTRPHRARTRRLAATAAAATLALVAGELAHVWRRGRAPLPSGTRDLVRGGGIAARETVEVLRAGYRSGSADETALLNLFVAFGGTFGAARAVTHAIRRGSGPFGNVRIGRRHIHHFVPGIALALGAGGASIAFRHQAVDRWLALPFGAGAALIIDETALLIEARGRLLVGPGRRQHRRRVRRDEPARRPRAGRAAPAPGGGARAAGPGGLT